MLCYASGYDLLHCVAHRSAQHCCLVCFVLKRTALLDSIGRLASRYLASNWCGLVLACLCLVRDVCISACHVVRRPGSSSYPLGSLALRPGAGRFWRPPFLIRGEERYLSGRSDGEHSGGRQSKYCQSRTPCGVVCCLRGVRYTHVPGSG